jgi:hypothetical protein
VHAPIPRPTDPTATARSTAADTPRTTVARRVGTMVMT